MKNKTIYAKDTANDAVIRITDKQTRRFFRKSSEKKNDISSISKDFWMEKVISYQEFLNHINS